MPEVPPEVMLPKKKRKKRRKKKSKKLLPEAVVSSVTMVTAAIIRQSGFRYIVPVDDNKLCYIFRFIEVTYKRNHVLTILLPAMDCDQLGFVRFGTLVDATHTMAMLSCAWIPIL